VFVCCKASALAPLRSIQCTSTAAAALATMPCKPRAFFACEHQHYCRVMASRGLAGRLGSAGAALKTASSLLWAQLLCGCLAELLPLLRLAPVPQLQGQLLTSNSRNAATPILRVKQCSSLLVGHMVWARGAQKSCWHATARGTPVRFRSCEMVSNWSTHCFWHDTRAAPQTAMFMLRTSADNPTDDPTDPERSSTHETHIMQKPSSSNTGSAK
jgi:hypothetical protein